MQARPACSPLNEGAGWGAGAPLHVYLSAPTRIIHMDDA